ncbi:hypothetical protein BC940DRAFT_158226 [Gongronella butleri]|nr:hypothetical protein BC940DRAFT_158226 [Gongronella butleri]
MSHSTTPKNPREEDKRVSYARGSQSNPIVLGKRLSLRRKPLPPQTSYVTASSSGPETPSFFDDQAPPTRMIRGAAVLDESMLPYSAIKPCAEPVAKAELHDIIDLTESDGDLENEAKQSVLINDEVQDKDAEYNSLEEEGSDWSDDRSSTEESDSSEEDISTLDVMAGDDSAEDAAEAENSSARRNALPLGYTRLERPRKGYFFGQYVGDGFHTRYGGMGFGLKSSSVLELKNLADTAGVRDVIIKMYAGQPTTKYGGATSAHCRWDHKNAAAAREWMSTGFPSSKRLNTVIYVLIVFWRKYKGKLVILVCLVLGLVAADGCVAWSPRCFDPDDEGTTALDAVIITARDKLILPWLLKEWMSFGGCGEVHEAKRQNGKVYYELRFPGGDHGNLDLWRKGLEALEQDDCPLAPRIQLLRAFVWHTRVPFQVLSPKAVRIQYLDLLAGKNDIVSKAIAQ